MRNLLVGQRSVEIERFSTFRVHFGICGYLKSVRPNWDIANKFEFVEQRVVKWWLVGLLDEANIESESFERRNTRKGEKQA